MKSSIDKILNLFVFFCAETTKPSTASTGTNSQPTEGAFPEIPTRNQANVHEDSTG